MVKVLLVDDDQMVINGLKRNLKRLRPNWKIISSNSGTEALDILQALSRSDDHKIIHCNKKINRSLNSCWPDLIISDVRMPQMNGYDFLNILRQRFPHNADIPVIFLTGNSTPKEILQGRRAGIDDYLLKPINQDLLITTIECRLDQVRRIRKAEEVRQLYYAEKSRTKENGKLVNALFHAVDNDEFKVFYQPKVSKDGKAHKAEALIRWMPDDVTMIPPNVFIEVAEKSHIILPMTERLLELVIEDVRNWKAMGYKDIQVAINTSSLHFISGEFQTLIREIPNDLRRNISFEITERDLVAMNADTLAQLNEAKKIGIDVYIDDFGVGHSSLAYLKNMPVTGIKIDKSFIDDIEHSETSVLLLENIIQLGKIFELAIVAEGVETEGQTKILFERDCDFIQGFYFSKPMPGDHYTTFLQSL
ncbi:MAG: EAL domain-containing response regulator [Methylocystaceae bacterium]|nr:EAL domain-containing response regulator [Methylocystaceae bacterium]